MQMARVSFLLAGCFATVIMSAAANAHAETTANEAELKAAYLLNFAQFIGWPLDLPSFTICQYGNDTLGAGAAALSRRTIRGKGITVRSVTGKALSGCDVLYIGAAEKSRIREITQMLRGTNTLTVSDAEGAAKEGAVIGLSVQGQKIVFDVNLAEARRNNLVISAKLLSLAKSVVDAP
jgi:hypothetical protein